MKKQFRSIVLALGFMLTSASLTFAQGNLDDLLKGSQADANYLAQGYLEPFLKVTATGLNQGWFNTAKPHKIAGFDITASLAFVSLPSSSKLFTVDNNRLENISLEQDVNGIPVAADGVGQIPTIFGPSGDENQGRFGFNIVGNDFDAPDGGDFGDIFSNRIPIPVANVGIGLPKGTELKVRWTPKIDIGDGELSMIGFGLMHDIKQHIPGIKLLPFDLSALITYSRFNVGVDFTDPNVQNGRGDFTVTGTTVQAIISKKISVLTPYAAIGYGFGKASVDVKGSYVLEEGTPAVTDPVSLSATQNGPRVTAGLRLKLLILTIHADYTLQKYSTLTAGVGLSIR